MFSVCKQVVEKVDGTELEGGAFQKASFEVCSHLLERDMKTVDAPIVDGCNYFSTQLVAARTKGPVKTDQFCSQLTGGGDRSAATDTDAEPVKTSLAELSPNVAVSSEKAPLWVETSLMEGGSRKVLLRKASNVAHPDTLNEAGPKAVAPPSKKEPAYVYSNFELERIFLTSSKVFETHFLNNPILFVAKFQEI